MRGRTKAQIIAALRAARSAAEPELDRAPKQSQMKPKLAERVAPLADSLETFWVAADELENLRFTLAPAPVDAAPVKRLGEPAFWQSRPALLP